MFAEVKVYEGIAERTGITVDRATVRRSKSVCQSVGELARKVRLDGDGTFYLATEAWPENTERIDLNTKWTTMG